MESNYTAQNLLLLPACAPSVFGAPTAASAVIAAPRPTRAPRVLHDQIQAELGQVLVSSSGNRTSGFGDLNDAVKRMTDGANGVPPRGRPV